MLDRNVPQPWRGQTTLVFALAAAAVGIGNLFRFPWLLGEHGGAPFFIAWIAGLTIFTIPVLVAEVVLGSHGRGSPLGAMRWASDQSGQPVAWSWIGLFQAGVAMLLAIELAVVTAWMIDRAVVLSAGHLAAASAVETAGDFVTLTDNHDRVAKLMALVLGAAGVFAAFGLRVAMVLIGWLALPAIVVALLALVGYSFERGDITLADEYLFAQRYDDFDFAGAMYGFASAIGTMAAGTGIGLSFGARTPGGVSLLRSVAAAALIDTSVAVLLAVIIIPLLFATNVAPTDGLALVFVAIPYAFANLPLGDVYGALFFGTVALAGFAALVALLEPAIQIVRREVGLGRTQAAALVTVLLWLVAVALMQLGPEALVRLDRGLVGLLIPGSMLLLAVFAGWRWPRPMVRGELYLEPNWLFNVWWELLRLAVPVGLVITMLWHWR